MPDVDAAGDAPSKALTYSQLADILDMKDDSVRKMAARRGWKKIQGNDGFLRVLVPLDALPAPAPAAGPPAEAGELMAMRLDLARLEAENALLRDGRDRDRGDIDRARAEADRWHAEFVRLRDQAEAPATPVSPAPGAFNWRGWWRRSSP